MIAIISALDQESSDQVRALWRTLEMACHLRGIFHFPTPHMSWFAAESLETSRAEPILQQLAESCDPFMVHTFGLGIFPGEHPVLYLPVVKSQTLLQCHNKIWNQTQPYSEETKLYYSPSFWLPHITLAIKDIDQDTLLCAVNAVVTRQLSLNIVLDNVMIVEQNGDEIGATIKTFKLG